MNNLIEKLDVKKYGLLVAVLTAGYYAFNKIWNFIIIPYFIYLFIINTGNILNLQWTIKITPEYIIMCFVLLNYIFLKLKKKNNKSDQQIVKKEQSIKEIKRIEEIDPYFNPFSWITFILMWSFFIGTIVVQIINICK